MFALLLPNYQTLSDQDLRNCIKDGDENAFSYIYDQTHKKVYNYIMTLVNYNADDAYTVTSDVYIKFFNFCKEDKELSSIKSLLYSIAHNSAVDFLRGSKNSFYNPDIVDMDSNKGVDDVVDNLEREFTQSMVRDALEKMNITEKNILYLYYFEELSYQEIGDIMGLPKNTIGSLLLRAKQKLATLLPFSNK